MKTRTQCEHIAYNATHYPGTRQLCILCDCPTERCEDDSIYSDEIGGPLCEECYENYSNHRAEEYDD